MLQTHDELEDFLMRHGENIIDLLGAEVDRIEAYLRVRGRREKKSCIIMLSFHYYRNGTPKFGTLIWKFCELFDDVSSVFIITVLAGHLQDRCTCLSARAR